MGILKDETIKQSVIEHSLHSGVKYTLNYQVFSDDNSVDDIIRHIKSDANPGTLYVPINHRVVAFVHKEIVTSGDNNINKNPKTLTDLVTSQIDFFRQDLEELQTSLAQNITDLGNKFDGDEALQKFFLYSNLCKMNIFPSSQEQWESIERELDSYFESQNSRKDVVKDDKCKRFMAYYTLSKLSNKKEERKDLFSHCALFNRVQLTKTKTIAENIIPRFNIPYDPNHDDLFFDTVLLNLSLPLSREERLKIKTAEMSEEIDKFIETEFPKQEDEPKIEKLGYFSLLAVGLKGLIKSGYNNVIKNYSSLDSKIRAHSRLALGGVGLSAFALVGIINSLSREIETLYMSKPSNTLTNASINDDDKLKTPVDYALFNQKMNHLNIGIFYYYPSIIKYDNLSSAEPAAADVSISPTLPAFSYDGTSAADIKSNEKNSSNEQKRNQRTQPSDSSNISGPTSLSDKEAKHNDSLGSDKKGFAYDPGPVFAYDP